MTYFVVGTDGNQYGPADIPTLRQWVGEQRIHAQTPLKDVQTGASLVAGDLRDLFPAAPQQLQPTAPPPTNAYPYGAPAQPQNYQPYPRATQSAGEDNSAFWGSIIRSVVAVVFFFFLHGIGLIWGGYALYYAIKCHSEGHSKGPVAIIVAALALLLVGAGWILRLGGTGI